MKPALHPFCPSLAFRALAAALALCAGAAVQATDLATEPLQTAATTTVRPNLMFILDASGSMGSDFLPDYVDASGTSGFCRSGQPGANPSTTDCNNGDVPFYSSAFNGNYYNPQVTYSPPHMPSGWTGTDFKPQTKGNTSSWTSVFNDPYVSPGSKSNIVGNYVEAYFCRSGSDCKRNGIDTNNPFFYWTVAGSNPQNSNDVAYPKDGTGSNDNYLSRDYRSSTTGPFYYDIEPVEHCSDPNLVNCTLSATPTGIFTFPAYVRFCRNMTDATSTGLVSDLVSTSVIPTCISKFVNQGTNQWRRARYGKFKRTNIVETGSYPNRPLRTDCAAKPTCTGAEEMTNFANWYAYYRDRMHMMKTSTGLAFAQVDDRFRVGFVTIKPGSPVPAAQFLALGAFDNAQKLAFYQKLYAQNPGGNTPLREALSRVGRYFANKTGGINAGMSDDPVQYSCQKNFALLTTDGYWNDAAGQRLDGSAINNLDNSDSGFSTRAEGAYDGNLTGASNTLADVALYYYQTDLRNSSLSNCTSGSGTGQNVCNDADPDPKKANQRMQTYTLGLVDGLMRYQADYDTSTSGDFARIKAGSTSACSWTTGVCNWPVPQNDQQSALDDLWHAAVNGRGRYYNARDPATLSDGLNGVLKDLQTDVAAAAAAATSTPNITPTDNFVFTSTYRTTAWDGRVIAQRLDTQTGNVITTELWNTWTTLDAAVPAARKIWFRSGSSLAPFNFADLTTAGLQAHFENKCAQLAQCVNLPPTDVSGNDKATLNSGTAMVNYLRGDKAREGIVFRQRDHIMGDTVNAAPAYVAKPQLQFGDGVTPDYATFKNTPAIQNRTPTLYVGANDGMLHALNANTGVEMWAYVPTMVMPKMHVLADENYAIKHNYYVDGSPVVMDAYFNSNWHTVLVAGLNRGGRGYYALDVTDPDNPLVLWEFCADAAMCANNDPDLGLTYGNPVVTKRPSDGKWVALFTSGYYDSTTTGDGRGHLYVVDLVTGQLLGKYDTTAGSAGNPSGLAEITALANNFAVDNTTLAVYGGDVLGNLWRFDLALAPTTSGAVTRLGLLSSDAAGASPQPITTRPEVTKINNEIVLYVATGKYLGQTDLTSTQIQTVYALKDTNTNLGVIRGRADIVANTATFDGTNITIPSGVNVNWTSQNGWRVDLAQAGERVNIDPVLVQGTLIVVSNRPNADACSAGGESFAYQFNYLNPTAVSSSTNGTTLGTRVANAIAVGLTVIKLPSGAVKALIPTSDTKLQTIGVNIGSETVTTRRIGWRQLFE